MTEQATDPVSRADAALDRVVALQAEIDALMARRSTAIEEFENAFSEAYPPSATQFRERACRAELACALRLPERSAERLMGEARVLVRLLPATLSGLAAGRYSYRHAQVLVDQTAGLSGDDRGAVERVALGSAGSVTAARFARIVRTLCEQRDPANAIERTSTAFAERHVAIEPAADGMAYLTAYLGAVDAAAIHDRLTGAAHRHRADDDPRTLAQLRADVLADALLDRETTLDLGPSMRDTIAGDAIDAAEMLRALERDLGPFRGVVPTVIVTVPIDTLLGGDEPATLDGIGPVDAATARRLTSHAPGLYRLLTHPETGAALSLGRTSYQLSEGLRRWLRIRDGSCRFPTCGIRARRCDIDHTHDWARGGPSDHFNLAHVSRGHHTLKHHGGWRATQTRPGVITWTSYLGREYTTHPELAMEPR